MSEPTTYAGLIERIAAWANVATDVHMVLIVGSRARTECPHDEWSDLDVIFVVSDPEKYIRQAQWVNHFCRPLLTLLEPTAVGGYTERRVLFEGGLDVDFSIVPTDIFKAELTPEVMSVFHRGVKVLVDKDGLSNLLPNTASIKREVLSPNYTEVLELINEFFYQFIWCSKKLCRGELWSAKMCCDGGLKWQLLRMIEWHTRLTQSSFIDTWHNGRFLDRWADASVLDDVKTAFASYDVESVWKALFQTKDLFKQLLLEVATTLNYELPITDMSSVERLVISYYDAFQRA